MSSKTKIVVLHMKEIIYTALFAFLGIILIILLAIMFFPGKKETPLSEPRYPEFTETHIHRVSDAIQPSHPLSSASRILSLKILLTDSSFSTKTLRFSK